MKNNIRPTLDKKLTLLFTSIFCFFISGCSTTQIASQKHTATHEKYTHYAVFAIDTGMIRSQLLEDKLVAALQAKGISAFQGYKIKFSANTQPTTEITDAILKTGADAVLIVNRSGESSNSIRVEGTQIYSAMDSKGNFYTYQAPSSSNYIKRTQDSNIQLFDIRKQKVTWIASAESKTVSPESLSLLSDFHESSIENFVVTLVNKMQEDGLLHQIRSSKPSFYSSTPSVHNREPN